MLVAKKIGIITIMDYGNYGNRLQNYALTYYLQKNYDLKVETLTLIPEYKRRNIFIDFKQNLIVFLCRFYNFSKKKFDIDTVRWANFSRWNKKIPIRKIYGKKQIPQSINNEYDYFIVGSDQVWNYTFSYNRFYDYFLCFATNDKKIALSASFGVDVIPMKWKSFMRKELLTFNKISVRETSGKKIIKDLIGADIDVLIDPTMLLNAKEWYKLAKKPQLNFNLPYILTCFIGKSERMFDIENWAREKGYQIFNLFDKSCYNLYITGPREYLYLIANAKLVCTDSFHSVVFSIIFSVPFIVFNRKGTQCDMSSRLHTLLNTFDFDNRWEFKVQKEDYLKCDFTRVDDILSKKQKQVQDFFRECFHY